MSAQQRPTAESDAAIYCGREYGEAAEGECECPRCVAKPLYPPPVSVDGDYRNWNHGSPVREERHTSGKST